MDAAASQRRRVSRETAKVRQAKRAGTGRDAGRAGRDLRAACGQSSQLCDRADLWLVRRRRPTLEASLFALFYDRSPRVGHDADLRPRRKLLASNRAPLQRGRDITFYKLRRAA